MASGNTSTPLFPCALPCLGLGTSFFAVRDVYRVALPSLTFWSILLRSNSTLFVPITRALLPTGTLYCSHIRVCRDVFPCPRGPHVLEHMYIYPKLDESREIGCDEMMAPLGYCDFQKICIKCMECVSDIHTRRRVWSSSTCSFLVIRIFFFPQAFQAWLCFRYHHQ